MTDTVDTAENAGIDNAVDQSHMIETLGATTEHAQYTCSPKEVGDYTLFHRVWTHAVNSAGYRKDEWQEFEKRLRLKNFSL